MKESNSKLLIVLSAPPEVSRQELRKILDSHNSDHVTIYLREADQDNYSDMTEGFYVCSDKPSSSKLQFLSELRTTLYDQAVVLDHGHWSFFSARCLFFFARARHKTVRTERGSFELSFWQPIFLLSHLAHRHRHRSGSVAGLPPGTPAPFLLGLYRKTLGLALGWIRTMLEYSWRRIFRAST